MLNEAYELLLRYFALHSSVIGFPELAYPSIVRVYILLHAIITQCDNYDNIFDYFCSYVRSASQSHSPGLDFN